MWRYRAEIRHLSIGPEWRTDQELVLGADARHTAARAPADRGAVCARRLTPLPVRGRSAVDRGCRLTQCPPRVQSTQTSTQWRSIDVLSEPARYKEVMDWPHQGFTTDRLSRESEAIVGVRLSVRLFPLYFVPTDLWTWVCDLFVICDLQNKNCIGLHFDHFYVVFYSRRCNLDY